jgi:hypothetical protein
MARYDKTTFGRKVSALFNYSYVVLAIAVLLTVGATIAYYQERAAVRLMTPVLDGLR